jgi:hypothetical protein
MIREDCVSRGRGIIHAGNTQRCGVHRGVRAQIAAPHTATDTVYACMVNRTGNRRLLDEVRRIPVVHRRLRIGRVYNQDSCLSKCAPHSKTSLGF